MKKQTIALTLLLFTCIAAFAQKEYRLNKSTGKLHLDLNGALIEGYDGNEIIFSSQTAQDEEEDERAKGLQAISGSGYKDNTGLGINVTEEGQDVHVNLVGNRVDNGLLTIRVPKQMAVTFNYNKTLYAEPVTLKNIKGEIELATTYNSVVLENNSGPMNIKTVHGGVDAIFENDIQGPVSIISVYEYVDISLPVSTKANLELGTSYGKLYAADEFNIAIAKEVVESRTRNEAAYEGGAETTNLTVRPPTPPTPPTAVSVSGTGRVTAISITRANQRENIKGTVNGGGEDLIFKSTHGNVYLRTK